MNTQRTMNIFLAIIAVCLVLITAKLYDVGVTSAQAATTKAKKQTAPATDVPAQPVYVVNQPDIARELGSTVIPVQLFYQPAYGNARPAAFNSDTGTIIVHDDSH